MITELEIKEESLSLTEKVNVLTIVDQASFEATSAFIVDIQNMKKVVKEHYGPMRKKANEAHKAITKQEKDDLSPLDDADRRLRSIRSAYVQKVEEERRKKQAKLDAAAEKKAEKEREKLRRKAEAEKDPEVKQELEEKAEEVYAQPNIAPVGVEKSSKVDGGGGISWVDDIEITITDPMALLNQIVGGRAPITLVEIKPAMVKRWVKTNGIKHGQIPGIAIKSVKVERVRTG